MANLFDPPPKYAMPLSAGGDMVVDFRNNPTGDGTTFVAYEAGVTLTLYVDTDTPTEVDADITDEHAVVRIESDVADLIPTGTKWRLILATDDTPTTETVVAYGTMKRFD
jgi:hypothetical protein